MPEHTTTDPIDWDGPWGGVVHVAAWCADAHDNYDPEEGR